MNRSLSKRVCILFVFCAATAIGSPAQTLTTIYSFCSQANCTDGLYPHAGLIQAADGNFYGTTEYGGAGDFGAAYKVTLQGTLTTLHSFDGTDGDNLLSGLLQATDGNFYGTTYEGGISESGCGFNGTCGTVFKITPMGTLTTLYSFCSQPYCSDGDNPTAGLVQATDGNLYGTTGGSTAIGNYGTVFTITPSGTLTTLYSFCSQANCADGEYPLSLVQGTDGNFYGTTYGGGTSNNCQSNSSNGCGTVFKITPQGMLTTLHSFDGTDGAYPEAGLVQGTDGNFYGTTNHGGTGGYCTGYTCGTVFKVTPTGTLTTLHSFDSTEGAFPYGELVQATDGNFYGTTNGGGSTGNGHCSGGCGTLFTITPGGALTTLYSFCSLANCADGILPYGALVQATDGTFYGTTYEGGAHGSGTVFSFPGPSPIPLQFVPVAPCRLVDTRTNNGGNGPIQGGTFEIFDLPLIAQQKGCADLSSAAAYSLNPTVVPSGPLGYLTIWPSGRNMPVVSTMNSVDGRVKANAAIVPGGAGEAINVFASNTTDLVLDIDGYFAPVSNSTLAFYPVTPCRVADTRNNNYPPGLGPPSLSGGVPRDFPILNSTCGIPNTAQAYSFNVTAVPPGPLGYLTVWPAGQNQPVVSTLNDVTGTVVANAAIVPAGTGGDIDAFASNNTDLVIDVNGYFAPPGQNGLSLYSVAPCRVLDTRQLGNGQPFVGELTVNVVGSVCGPPSQAQAYVFNATVVPSGQLGYLTLWPDGGKQPGVSTLNAVDGAVTSNMAIVPNSDGSIDAFASNLTQLVLDISAYFAP